MLDQNYHKWWVLIFALILLIIALEYIFLRVVRKNRNEETARWTQVDTITVVLTTLIGLGIGLGVMCHGTSEQPLPTISHSLQAYPIQEAPGPPEALELFGAQTELGLP